MRWLDDVSRLWRSERGGVAMIFAAALPALAVAVTAGIELAEVQTASADLQQAADAGAIKGARELGTDQSAATAERARLFADSMAAPLRRRWTIATAATQDVAIGSVTVIQSAQRPSFFGSLLPPGGFKLNVSATARANAANALCVLALQPSSTSVLSLQQSAAMHAAGCLVQSDSDLSVGSSASVQAGAAYAVGAATGPISPSPLSDAPAIPDPFSTLPINFPSSCSDFGVMASGGSSVTLQPGLHCGDIRVTGNGLVTLAPGEHYFLNANLDEVGNAQVVGTDAVILLKGTSVLNFKGNASLSLEGRHSGPFAGFALISDRSYTGTVSLSTTSARKILGTIYLPNASLSVSGNGNKVADQSAWTVVVANQISVAGSADLVINTAYAAASVPVPTGVGPKGSVALTK